jgi:hypothetical protein
MGSTEFSKPSHRGAGLLFLLGLALIATGVAFALAPEYSWKVTKVARQATALGLGHGLIVLSGALFVGLGIVARAAGAPPEPRDTRGELESLQAELNLLNEQFSTKLAQIRTSLLQVSEGLTSVTNLQQAQLQSAGDKGAGGDHSQDAVFRLAASLDKLHAHLDERVHAVDLQLRSGFEAVLHASHEVRRALGPGVMPGAHASAPAHHGHPAHHPAQPTFGAPAQGGGASGIDFYETMQKLDAIAGDGGPASPPQAPFPSAGQSLDVLMPEEYRDRY